MRYAIISDIHANYVALTSVLKSIRGQSVDQIVCLGDIVGYGPQPRECLQALCRTNAVVVAGNHDFAAANKIDITTFNLYARESTLWTRDVLDSEALSFLADLPLVVELDGFSAVHGTLHSPELFDYVQCCYEASLTFSAMEQPLCFIGHSHVPIVFTERGLITYSTDTTIPIEPEVRTIINVGSVGQPRDRDPRSCYAIYDTSEQEVRILRVRYDVEAAVSKVETVGLPRALGERLRVGR